MTDAFGAADYPFGLMLKDLKDVQRGTSRTAVFQTMFNMLNYPADAFATDTLAWEFTDLDTGYVKYDCALYVQPHGNSGLLLQLVYQSEILDADVVGQVVDATVAVLRALVRSPEGRLRDIVLLPTSEFANTAAVCPGD